MTAKRTSLKNKFIAVATALVLVLGQLPAYALATDSDNATAGIDQAETNKILGTASTEQVPAATPIEQATTSEGDDAQAAAAEGDSGITTLLAPLSSESGS